MMKIYGRANSINVRKVLWLCQELDLPYERFDYGRDYTPTSTPEFVKVSPFGIVPVLDDDGFVMIESNAIVRYLAVKHGRDDLFPQALHKRAAIESWMDWSSTILSRGIQPLMFGVYLRQPEFLDPKRIAQGTAEWTAQMRRLDSQLAAHGPYLMGDAFTIADIPVGLVVNRWYSIDFEKPALDAVSAYYERLSQRPAYQMHGRNGTP